LCECDSVTLGLDLNHLEDLCKRFKPAVVMLVHVLGHPNSMDELLEICERYGVLVVEDACEAVGTIYREKLLGSLGVAGTFSFYYGHQLSTIEGGMIALDDPDLADIIYSLRSHGWARDVRSETRKKWEQEWSVDEFRNLYTFYYEGFNFRSTDLNAFLGISQMKKVDRVVSIREMHYSTYVSKLGDKYWMQTSVSDRLSAFAYGTLVNNRLEVFGYLKEHGIESRPLICGSIGRQPFWCKRFGEVRLRMADNIHDLGIYMPIHHNLTDEEISFVADKFLEVAEPFWPKE